VSLCGRISKENFREKLCGTTVEMIQQKHTFLIETESVRRMFRAKPSTDMIVVQLLVDLSAPHVTGNGFWIAKLKTFSGICHQVFIRRQPNGKHRSEFM
jgi:hypothetical protein